jgi:hypothetical protein
MFGFLGCKVCGMGGAVRKGIEQKARQHADKNYYINNWRLMRVQRSGGGWGDSV